jgi:hypothetical protein
MALAFAVLFVLVVIAFVAGVHYGISENDRRAEQVPVVPVLTPAMFDPFADHPVQCKCYHHR